LTIDVPLWGSLKLGVALYFLKQAAPAQRRFLRGVGRKMEGWKIDAAGDTLAGGVQHEESDAAKRHS